MKLLLALGLLAALAGCATQPGPRAYGQAGYGAPYGEAYRGTYGQSADPSQWRVVSVTPVPLGTGERIAAQSADGSRVEYSSEPLPAPVQTVPVYPAPPVVAVQPYWPPLLTFSLGLVLGKSWGSGHHHHHHHRGRGRR
jgi:hypothetical protein